MMYSFNYHSSMWTLDAEPLEIIWLPDYIIQVKKGHSSYIDKNYLLNLALCEIPKNLKTKRIYF